MGGHRPLGNLFAAAMVVLLLIHPSLRLSSDSLRHRLVFHRTRYALVNLHLQYGNHLPIGLHICPLGLLSSRAERIVVEDDISGKMGTAAANSIMVEGGLSSCFLCLVMFSISSYPAYYPHNFVTSLS